MKTEIKFKSIEKNENEISVYNPGYNHNDCIKLGQFRGTMLGLALGDILGMPVEGWKKEQIQEHVGKITFPIDPVLLYDYDGRLITQDKFGRLKYYTKDLKLGQYTDDTILSKALAESLVAEKGFNLSDIAARQAAEYTKRLLPDGSVLGGFGRTTADAFKQLLKGVPPLSSGVIGGPGNAPAMKMAPLGLYIAASDESSPKYGNKYNLGLEQAELVGRMTHLDPRSVVSGVVQMQAIYALIKGCDRDEFINSCLEVCLEKEKPVSDQYTLWRSGSLGDRLKWIKSNKDAKIEDAHLVLGSDSNVFCSYPFALFMFQRYWDDPLEGLIETVNFGGDCDTTGSMYGALAGAKNGIIFPNEWLNVLEGKRELDSLGRDLYQLTEKV
ncbi:MAG TPA: ADP-ribosylglycohydrolase family protein [Candidatus Nanoarchaeia archaeon]|nr:ADP-ribosylglycohydrolase family protein [Candidatus Nanoarchaeia archaeon]